MSITIDFMQDMMQKMIGKRVNPTFVDFLRVDELRCNLIAGDYKRNTSVDRHLTGAVNKLASESFRPGLQVEDQMEIKCLIGFCRAAVDHAGAGAQDTRSMIKD